MLACVSACLALTACSTPRRPDGAGGTVDAGQFVAELGDYAARLSRQSEPDLKIENQRLEDLPPSPERTLRLALLHSQRGAAIYDPQLAASLLIQLATSEPKTSVYGQLAQMLFTGLPDPQVCADADRLNTLNASLADQLEQLHSQQRSVEDQMGTLRTELEAERSERTRLEKQLKALKSLEAQIKGRDSTRSQ